MASTMALFMASIGAAPSCLVAVSGLFLTDTTSTTTDVPPGVAAPFGSCARAIGAIRIAHMTLVDSNVANSLFMVPRAYTTRRIVGRVKPTNPSVLIIFGGFHAPYRDRLSVPSG